MTTEAQTHQPDHATTRIVTELAAALLPHLKETVSSELTRTIESLPINVDRELKEALSSLKHIRAVCEDMKAALGSAQSAASLLSQELLPLPRACETMNEATVRLEQLMTKLDALEAAQTNETLRSLEAAVHDWRGILKANGRAQTKELIDFSAEVAEQVGWLKSSVPVMVEEILEKKLQPSGGEQPRTSAESVSALETRLIKLEKMIIVGGIFMIAFCTVIAAVLFFTI
jgi:hypothetical protein